MISCASLDELRKCVSLRLSAQRYAHTLGVERAASFLADMCLPDKGSELCAAALLHDITKELSLSEQLEIIEASGYPISEYDREAAAVLHSFTAPYVISRDFSDYATDEIINAVAKHTLGASEMSIFDEILFLADFIEDTRKYASSKAVCEYVLSSMKKGELSKNISVLHNACLMEIESTILCLTEANRQIHPKMLEAKAGIVAKI